MRNNLLIAMIICLCVVLTACNNTSQPETANETKQLEVTTENSDKREKLEEEPTPDDKQPEAEDIEDKPEKEETEKTTEKEPVKTEESKNETTKEITPTNQKPATKKQADPIKETKTKKHTDNNAAKTEEQQKNEAKQKAAEEKKAKEVKQAEEAKEAEEENYNNQSVFDKVIHLTNIERKNTGVAALEKEPDLMKSAQAKSVDMRTNESMDHDSPRYGGITGILNHFGISYSMAAENIGQGHSSPEAIVEAWMNSSGHQANILNPNYTHIGVGYDSGFWTQQFIKK